MKFTLPQIRKFAIIASFVILAFVSGWVASDRGFSIKNGQITSKLNISRDVPPDQKVDFSLFWQVWDKLESDYFDRSKINEQEMVLGAIKGMVGSLKDPYTVFLPPEEQKRTQEDLTGHFEGVGIEIGFRGTRLVVQTPLEGSPAQKAGVKAGDFIVGIKDKKKEIDTSTVGMNLVDAVGAIRGAAGTKVTLIVTREGEDKPLEIEIERAKIDVPTVKLTFRDQLAVLRLIRFGGNTNGEWKKAIREIKSKDAAGVVLDLRNNPGGYLAGAVEIASEFLSRGMVVVREDGSGNKEEFAVTGQPSLPNIKLVVLVNGGSASASEIVAGALKDWGRAKVVGQKTFGKGTIQEARPVGAGSGLHITTAKWLTPKGTWVNEVGLEPDVEIEDKADTEVDEQLEKAIELLK